MLPLVLQTKSVPTHQAPLSAQVSSDADVVARSHTRSYCSDCLLPICYVRFHVLLRALLADRHRHSHRSDGSYWWCGPTGGDRGLLSEVRLQFQPSVEVCSLSLLQQT